MLGQFKPVAYEPYGRRREGVPRWLVVLMLGLVLGVAGVLVIEDRYFPRLTINESARLQGAFERADAQRRRLESELEETKKRLEATLAEGKSAGADLAAARTAVQRLSDELASVIAALPPDPRAGSVEVRAGRFAVKSGSLQYDVVLTRPAAASAKQASAKQLAAVLQLLATGTSARGVEATVSLSPVNLVLESQNVPRGSLQLPAGFKPRQATVQVIDRSNGKQLGMRVFLVE